MIRLAICDDEAEYQNILYTKLLLILNESEQEFCIDKFDSGVELVEASKNKKYEVVFLDIDMPKATGIDIADEIVEIMPRANVIFVTNRDDLVFDALKCNPYRFIRKSNIDEELKEAVISVIKKISKEDYMVVFESKKQMLSLSVREICYIESEKHYVNVYTDDNTHKLRMKIADCEKLVNNLGFIRIHHSFLVNIRKIRRITSKQVVLFNGRELPVSRSNIDKIKIQYSEMVDKYVDGTIL